MPDWPTNLHLSDEAAARAADDTAKTRPRPLNSLRAAATRLTGKSITSYAHNGGQGWQADAWDTYDQVGEQRFLATTLAHRMSQARMFVGMLDPDTNEPPVPVGSLEAEQQAAVPGWERAQDVFATLHESPTAMGQRVLRMGLNLFVAGEVLLVGIPSALLDGTTATPGTGDDPDYLSPSGSATGELPDNLDLEDLRWRVMSADELSVDKRKNVLVIRESEDSDEDLTCRPEDVVVLRVWRPHPRHYWAPDSPTRSSLPVLRELMGLTMHVSAQIDSRLAGAGVLLIPESADQAVRRDAAAGEDLDASDDPFTDALVEAMTTPIGDRSNASAVVPLSLTVPDDSIDKFRHISFAVPLDSEARNLRDEAIRRLALGQDAPPELLLGVGGMNHWGAWLVREDVVTTHIEPPLALICDALTTQFLWPVLAQQGMDPEDYKKFVVWYSVEHMILRPNRGQDALNLYDRGELTARALRDETGFSESAAPPVVETDQAVEIAMDMVRSAPSLAQQPGLPLLVEQLRYVLSGGTRPDDPGTDPSDNPGPPADEDTPADATGDGEAAPEEGALPDTQAEPAGPPGLAVANDWAQYRDRDRGDEAVLSNGRGRVDR